MKLKQNSEKIYISWVSLYYGIKIWTEIGKSQYLDNYYFSDKK